MANELITTNAAALAALVDKTTGDALTAAEWTTAKDSLQEANTATRAAGSVFAGPATGAAAAPTFRALTVTDMVALRTFVRPPGGVGGAGGFYQQNLFEIALNTPDALCGQVTVNVSILDTDTSKSGSYYYRATFLIHRYLAGGVTPTGASSIPAGLVQTAYLGSAGTSMGFANLAVGSTVAASILFQIQPVGFTSPTVTITAVMVLPGTNAVTII